jgi:AcrR family transcriptional regulator
MTNEAPPATPVRHLRADAVKNRIRLLDAAESLCAEHGIDIRVEEIAERAGVGVGTVYRHFASRDAIIQAVIDLGFEQWIAMAEDARARLEPGLAFFSFIDTVVTTRVVGSSFLASQWWSAETRRAITHRALPALTALMDGAKDAGTLRPEIELSDVIVLLRGLREMVDSVEPRLPGAWRRVMGLMLDGFRTRPEPPSGRVVPAKKLVSALCRAVPEAARPRADHTGTPA